MHCVFRFAMQLFSLSFFPVVRDTKDEEERKREFAHGCARARDQHTFQATHTVAPSINRCVCCFNLPWARVTSRQRAISATRKSLRNCSAVRYCCNIFSNRKKILHVRNKRNVRTSGDHFAHARVT